MTQKIFLVLILPWHIQCQKLNRAHLQDFVKGTFVTHFEGPRTVGNILYEHGKYLQGGPIQPLSQNEPTVFTRTGRICARTIHYIYETFKNYCMMDYVNCCEFYEVWQIVHMGECFTYVKNEEYVPYSWNTDSFLDGYYWQDAIVDS